MGGTIVVLVNGEVLASGAGSTISDQRSNAGQLAEGLLPILGGDHRVLIMHGNKPQVGFVLFRSELASHVLHSIPLDVCGADTQGATGYMISQALNNVLLHHNIPRKVLCLMTQTLVDSSTTMASSELRAIGPWFDRDKAENYRQNRGWQIVTEPGRGYRRGVPSYPVKEILEFDGIQNLVEAGYIVIAGGGGGIPVIRNANGDLEGVEAVIETEQLASMFARQLNANILLSIIEADKKFILSGFSTENHSFLELDRLEDILAHEAIPSNTVKRTLKAAAEFLRDGGDQVIVTTNRRLADTLKFESGLFIGSLKQELI